MSQRDKEQQQGEVDLPTLNEEEQQEVEEEVDLPNLNKDEQKGEVDLPTLNEEEEQEVDPPKLNEDEQKGEVDLPTINEEERQEEVHPPTLNEEKQKVPVDLLVSTSSSSSSSVSDNEEGLGISLVNKGKQFSIESVKTLDHLEDLRHEFELMQREAEHIHKSTEMDNFKSVKKSKSKLAQLLGNLEKLQFSQLDAVSTMNLHSGKSAAKSNRRELNTDIEDLQDFVMMLYSQYDAVPSPPVASPTLSDDKEQESIGETSLHDNVSVSSISDSEEGGYDGSGEEHHNTDIVADSTDCITEDHFSNNQLVECQHLENKLEIRDKEDYHVTRCEKYKEDSGDGAQYDKTSKVSNFVPKEDNSEGESVKGCTIKPKFKFKDGDNDTSIRNCVNVRINKDREEKEAKKFIQEDEKNVPHYCHPPRSRVRINVSTTPIRNASPSYASCKQNRNQSIGEMRQHLIEKYTHDFVRLRAEMEAKEQTRRAIELYRIRQAYREQLLHRAYQRRLYLQQLRRQEMLARQRNYHIQLYEDGLSGHSQRQYYYGRYGGNTLDNQLLEAIICM
jgi:hypothetical protein